MIPFIPGTTHRAADGNPTAAKYQQLMIRTLLLSTLVATSALPLPSQSAELLVDINRTPVARDGSVGGIVQGFAPIGTKHIGVARSSSGTLELHAFDPIARTATALSAFDPPGYYYAGINSSVIADLGTGRRLWFARGQDIWHSDGTAGGTARALQLNSAVYNLRDLGNGSLLFQTSGRIWVFDGTAASLLGSFSIRLQGDAVLTDPRLKIGYFIENGRNLWRTNGTAAGTRLVIGKPSFWLRSMALHNSMLLLAATGPNGSELWRSNGTAAGTVELSDINQGAASSIPQLADGATFGAYFYFGATTAQHGQELWRTDGTKSGTTLVADLRSNGSSGVDSLHAVGSKLFLSAYTGQTWDLHVYDGSTVRALGVGSKGSEYASLGNGRIAFSINRSTSARREFFVTDGKPTGTTKIEVRPGHDESQPLALTELPGNQVAFSAIGPQGDREYWVSDGTAAGTKLHIDARSGTNTASSYASTVAAAGPDGESHYFSAQPNNTPPRLYRRIGSTLTDLGTVSITSDVHEIVRNGTRLTVFSGRTTIAGTEPWVTDNTPTGTRMLADIIPGRSESRPTLWTSLDDRAVFVAFQATTGAEVWVTDGTPAGTKMLPEIRPGTASSDPAGFTVYGGQAVFAATDGSGKRALWTTDGTATGTKPWIANAPTHQSGPNQLTRHEELLYYFADNGIWSTDGTAANTKAIPGVTLPAEPKTAVWTDFTLYFVIQTTLEDQLWSLSGVTARRLTPSFRRQSIKEMTPVGPFLLFVAFEQSVGEELWVAQLRTAQVLADLRSGVASSRPTELTPAADGVYFSAVSSVARREIYFTTPSPFTLRRVTHLARSAKGVVRGGLTLVGDDLAFVGETERVGRELFRLRGVRAHTIDLPACSAGGIELEASPPYLGKTSRLSGRSLPGVTAQIVLLGLPTTTPALLPGSLCALRLAITGPVLLIGVPRSEQWRMSLSIPNDPVLSQRSVVVQTLGQRARQWAASNGVRLVIGR